METFELERMGLAPMTELEMLQFDGGGWPSLFKGAGVAWLVNEIIDNWDEIKQGFKEGYKAQV